MKKKGLKFQQRGLKVLKDLKDFKDLKAYLLISDYLTADHISTPPASYLAHTLFGDNSDIVRTLFGPYSYKYE